MSYKFNKGDRVVMRLWPEDGPGTIMGPWEGVKGDEGFYVSWDDGEVCAELRGDLAPAPGVTA